MPKRLDILIICTIVLLLFASCNDMYLFEDEHADARASSIKTSFSDGAILAPGSPFRVSVDPALFDQVPLGHLEFSLFDERGASVFGADYQEELGSGEAIVFDPSPYGIGYRQLMLELFDANERSLETRLLNFFLYDGEISIKSVDLYPAASVRPSSSALLLADCRGGDSLYARWSSGGELLSQGLLGSYRNGFVWEAPREEGIYSLRLELFPAAPSSNGDAGYDFSSSVWKSVELYVDPSAPGESDTLSSDLYSYLLLHFYGGIEASGSGAKGLDLEGSARPALQQGVFAYRFEKGSRLAAPLPKGAKRISYSMVPADGEGVLSVIFSLQKNEQKRAVAGIDREGFPFFLLSPPAALFSSESVRAPDLQEQQELLRRFFGKNGIDRSELGIQENSPLFLIRPPESEPFPLEREGSWAIVPGRRGAYLLFADPNLTLEGATPLAFPYPDLLSPLLDSMDFILEGNGNILYDELGISTGELEQ